jgi:hypothetical protein
VSHTAAIETLQADLRAALGAADLEAARAQLARVIEQVEAGRSSESLPLHMNIRLTLRGANGRIKTRRVLHNLICTAGKNLLLASGGTSKYVKDFAYVCIGTGSTAANAADTALEAEAARALGTVSNPTAASLKVSYTFPAGTGTGAITEAGLDHSAGASGAILNRQVFAAINKGASDTLQIDITIS